MNIADLEHFKNLLYEKEHNILDWLGQPVLATESDVQKAQELLGQIKDALERIDNKDFGACQVCKGAIELHRLEVQPVVQVCLGCITVEEREQLEEELFLASKIHRALLPQNVEKIEGFDIAVKSLAARVVGGDYYDFLPSRDSGISRVVIGDTMGKGLPAGLLMSNVQGALRILSEEIISPQRLISRLNEWLCRNVPVTKFISLSCVAIEQPSADSHKLVYTNAGHCPGILLKGNEVIMLEPTGGVIGVHAGFTYEEQELRLTSNDLLLLYTDGVTEAGNKSDDMFGVSRLIAFAKANRHLPLEMMLDKLVTEVVRFTGCSELEDDFTVIVLRKT
jgi:phosphoserine phosphatase RsbU/P